MLSLILVGCVNGHSRGALHGRDESRPYEAPGSQATFGALVPRKICSLVDLPSLAVDALTPPALRHFTMWFCWLQCTGYVVRCQGDFLHSQRLRRFAKNDGCAWRNDLRPFRQAQPSFFL